MEDFPLMVNNHISAKAAAIYSGYSLQYIRRLLRLGKLAGKKLGQLWLIEKQALDIFLVNAQ